MARKNKFRPGPAIYNPAAVVAMLIEGHWFYWMNKPKHPTVLLNMRLAVITRACERGAMRLAIENEIGDE